MYKITNTNGKTGGNWRLSYLTREDAADAIGLAMGWDSVVLSESFAVDDTTAWCVYESQEDCDADREGAYAPRVVEYGDEKRHGLTFGEWLDAAGLSHDTGTSQYDLRAAWRAGEDPAEYRSEAAS